MPATRRASPAPTGLLGALLQEGAELHFLPNQDPTLPGDRWSASDLATAAAGVAALLSSRGLAVGERILLCLDTGPDFVRWFLGALWAGVVPVPLPPLNPLSSGQRRFERIRAVMQDCAPRAVVGDGASLERLHSQLRAARDDRPLELDARTPGEPAAAPAAVPDDAAPTAFIQYTSGSTGAPKGVVVTRKNLRANLQAITDALAPRPQDRMLSWLPLHHDLGLVGGLLFALSARVPLYLFSPMGFVLRPRNWLRAISAHRITLSGGPHFAYSLCASRLRDADLAGLELSCWRLALDGSEPIRPANVRAFLRRFAPYGFAPSAYHPVYGMAEATLAICLPALGEGLVVDSVSREALARGVASPAPPGSAEAIELVSVGRPVRGHSVEIWDPQTHAPCPERHVGEVWFSGPSVSPRYFGQGRLERDREGTLQTGDLGYLAGGRLYLVDRLKDLIIHAGVHYFPADLERTVEEIPGLRRGRVVAFGVPLSELGTEGIVVAAEVRRSREAPRIARRIQQVVARALGIALHDVVLLPPRALPMTTTGKLMRLAARSAYLTGELEAKRRG